MKFHKRHISQVTLLALVAATSGCSKKSHRHSNLPQPKDTAQSAQEMSVGGAHRASLLQDLRGTLHAAFRVGLQSQGERLEGVSPSLVNATAFAAAEATAKRMADSSRSQCRFDVLRLGGNDWLKCVVREALTEDLSNAHGLRQLLESVLKIENAEVLGDIAALKKMLDGVGTQVLAGLADTLATTTSLDETLRQLSSRVDELRDLLVIIRDGVALNDTPWLAESFFAGRTFTFTNSLQQSSVGSYRVLNAGTYLVHLEVSANRLFIMRDKKGLYDGEHGEDIILGSYPIAATRKVGSETFYQVNFAEPLNKRFLLPEMMGAQPDPAIDLTAESMRVRVAHMPKSGKPELGSSGLFFDKEDGSLVLDELILLNGNAVWDEQDGTVLPGFITRKDWLRPTIRFTQALFAQGAADEEFLRSGSMSRDEVSAGLFQNFGVRDEGYGADAPYLPVPGQNVLIAPGSKLELSADVRVQKFNTAKPVTFVLSGNTPAAMVAPIKSAVVAYQDLFARTTPKGSPVPQIRALTQAEFEQENSTEGLRIGGQVNAADPRVNMIFWEDVPTFNSAWGTSLVSPTTGEVISGDIMLSGTMWAKNGCKEFMLRKWAARPRPGEKPPTVPHPLTYALNDLACNMTLLGMRIVGSNLTAEEPGEAPVNGERLMTAIEQGDSAAIKSMYLEAIKAPAALAAEEPNLERLANESEEAFAIRVASWYEGRRDDLRRKLGIASEVDFSKIKDSLGQLRSEADAALSHRSPVTAMDFVNGKNHIRVQVSDVRRADDTRELYMSNAGVPAVQSEYVKDPKDAARAMVRAVVVHELGHLFGLRHNFIGSTTPSVLEDGVTPPVPVATRTDSMMDYVDSAVSLDMGAMTDYSDPNGGLATPTFGAYDIAALANLYGLDASALKFKTPLQFCSDSGANMLGNCLPFDFGKSSFENALFGANMALQEMRSVKDTDFGNPFIANDLLRRLNYVSGFYRYQMTNMISLWGLLSQRAAYARAFDEQGFLIKFIDASFYAKGLTEPYFSDDYFLTKTGQKPVGIWDALRIQGDTLQLDPAKPQLIAGINAESVRRMTTVALLGVLDRIAAAGGEYNMDASFMKGLPNIKPLANQNSKDYLFRTMMIDLFARKMLVPSGTPVDNWVYLDGDRRPGSLARDISGNPVVLTFDDPMFNYTKSIRTKSNVMISDGAGGEKPVMAIANGNFDMREIIYAQLALAQLAPWGGAAGGSDSYERLLSDRNVLERMLSSERVSLDARPAAKFMVSVVDWLAANILPFGE